MVTRSIILIMAAVFLSGCATTQSANQPIVQLQTKVTDLEQRLEEQEKELVDLKYEMKESGKGDPQAVVTVEESKPVADTKSVAANFSGGQLADILRVNVSGSELQKALKGAGVYEGKVDGKIGPKTKAAVVEFQKAHNLKSDGVVGQKTWNELKQYVTE